MKGNKLWGGDEGECEGEEKLGELEEIF